MKCLSMGRGLEKCKSGRDLALIIIFTRPTVNFSPTRIKFSRKADKRTTCRTYFVAAFLYIYVYIYIYINIMGGKNDATTYPDKPVS